MKIFLLGLLVTILNFISVAQLKNGRLSQIEITLSNANGVPFYRGNLGDRVAGFEVDSSGNYYFMGGETQEKTILVKMNDAGKIIYKKTYNQFHANQIFLQNGSIYLFDNFKMKNIMYILNANDGKVLKQYSFMLKNKVNNYFWFTDSTIILWAWNYGEPTTLSNHMAYLKFNIKGNYIKEANNKYDIPICCRDDSLGQMIWFLGKLKDTLVFMQNGLIPKDKPDYKFWLEDSSGRVITTADIEEAEFGEPFLGASQEHWILRNRNIYILGQDENKALITKIPIDDLFGLSFNNNNTNCK